MGGQVTGRFSVRAQWELGMTSLHPCPQPGRTFSYPWCRLPSRDTSSLQDSCLAAPTTELRELTEPDNQGSDSFLWGARVGEQEVCFPEGYAFPGVGKA